MPSFCEIELRAKDGGAEDGTGRDREGGQEG